MIRVTTNGALVNYRTSLNKSSNLLNSSRDKVLSQRTFNSFGEDPAGATQAFKLRRALSRTEDQLSANNSILKKYEFAWSSLESVKDDLVEHEGKVSALKGATGDAGAGRAPLGAVLKSAAESVVQIMNSKYGAAFAFGGSDSLSDKAPFAFETDGTGVGYLTYRGVRVDAADGSDEKKLLDVMNDEATYVDVGAGLTDLGDGDILESSVFNASLSGIEFLGYGVDGKGLPNNVVSIMSRLGEIYSDCDPDNGDYASAADEEEADALAQKLNDALADLTEKWTELDGESTYLKSNASRLTTQGDTLTEQILGIEQVDLASAITDFSWAQYCYNAALKVGNSILSQSLIDYMN